MIDELSTAINAALRSTGEKNFNEMQIASKPLCVWIDYLLRRHEKNPAAPLLEAELAVIGEVVACSTISLVRPMLALLRTEIDLALAWAYYAEHPREWRNANLTDDGYKLKGELLKVFEQIEPSFRRRFGILRQIKTRKSDDPYRVLSAHVHLQSRAVLPKVGSISAVIQPDLLPQVVQMQSDVSEYIGDVFACLLADKWLSIPTELTDTLRARFKTPEQFQEFIRSGESAALQ